MEVIMYELLGSLTLALIPGFLLLDFIIQRRRYNKTRYWRLRGAIVTAFIFFFTGEVAWLWSQLFAGYHLLDLSALGTLAGAAAGILVYEFFHYWYHRNAHSWSLLWRAGHQMHHSAESLDAFGAFYLHPFDAAMFTTISSLVFFPILGVSTEAGVIAALFLTFNAMFQHANIGTPRWLGYLIQRPESHHIHHAKSVHQYNYADLPIFDIIFGTFENPEKPAIPECGFYKGASSRIWDMMIGKDVSRKPQVPPVVEALANKTAAA
jgi:sterol desaturase/sphingolipid hydroxylase (fatty acid hydroxylase superfamily)